MTDRVRTLAEVAAAWPYCRARSHYCGREVWCVLEPGHDGEHRAETLDWVEAVWADGGAVAVKDDVSILRRG